MSAEILKPFGNYGIPGANQDVCELLREMLEKAECGEIIGVGVCAVLANGCSWTEFASGGANTATVLGGVILLQNTILKSWDK
jgi:hypothetical protein